MRTIHPFKVTYRRRHPKVSPWINGGKPYYEKDVSEMEFMSREKAEEYIARKKRMGTGGYFRIHEGQFEVEEMYLERLTKRSSVERLPADQRASE